MKKTFHVAGINSALSASAVEKNVRAVSGVYDVNIKPSVGTMRVRYNDDKTNEEEIIASVASAGFVARAAEKGARPAADRESTCSLMGRVRWLPSVLITQSSA